MQKMKKEYDQLNQLTKWSDLNNRRLSKNAYNIFEQNIYIDINSYEIDLKLHYHEFYEIVYVIQGSATHIINNKKYQACMGDLFLMDCNTAHTMTDMSPNFEIIVVSFLPEIIDITLRDSQNTNDLLLYFINQDYFELQTSESFFVLRACSDSFEGILMEMYNEYINHKDFSTLIIKHLLTVVLSRIYRQILKKDAKNSRDHLASVLHYIDQHYNQNIKLEDLAKIAMLNDTYLSAQFKLKYGVSISHYINAKRIEQACVILKTTDRPILSIINDVGYKDSKFFYRSFKKFTGMTPGAYRNLK